MTPHKWCRIEPVTRTKIKDRRSRGSGHSLKPAAALTGTMYWETARTARTHTHKCIGRMYIGCNRNVPGEKREKENKLTGLPSIPSNKLCHAKHRPRSFQQQFHCSCNRLFFLVSFITSVLQDASVGIVVGVNHSATLLRIGVWKGKRRGCCYLMRERAALPNLEKSPFKGDDRGEVRDFRGSIESSSMANKSISSVAARQRNSCTLTRFLMPSQYVHPM